MEEKKFFTLSDKASNEYCCCVVRIGEVKPIEGTDFLATTDVYGTQIVVRKDQVKEGDIMFYAMNETELNAEFLHDNNLFEISSRDMNANAAEVNAIMENYEMSWFSLCSRMRPVIVASLQAENTCGWTRFNRRCAAKEWRKVRSYRSFLFSLICSPIILSSFPVMILFIAL